MAGRKKKSAWKIVKVQLRGAILPATCNAMMTRALQDMLQSTCYTHGPRKLLLLLGVLRSTT